MMMMMRRRLAVALAIAVALAPATGCASARRAEPAPAPAHGEAGDPHAHGDATGEAPAHGGDDHGRPRGAATVHHRFDDAERWAKRFEDPERDAWQEPAKVVAFCELEKTSKVADIGSATGYFPVRFARAAPEGVVYGLDIEPNLVNYLNLRAHREGLTNLVSLVCAPDDPMIPEPVDLIFICDTYHHIDARLDYFARLRERLAPGGELVIVDFELGDFPVGPKGDDHKLAPEVVIDELAEAGWKLARREKLRYQYVLAFTPAR